MDLGARLKLIDDTLSALLSQELCPRSPLLLEAARYSLLSPAKRMRPLLVLITCEMLGGNRDLALRPACALEMIHTYSLIHDDLPCMDDDDFRRGRPSLHKAFDEATAVLAGDFLLTYPFEILASSPGLSDALKTQLIAVLSKRAGGDGMIGGQILDLAAEGKHLPLEDLQTVHHLKTGALLSCAVEMGALLAGASQQMFKALRAFGKKIGLAFQIADDILDVTAGVVKKGKASGSDSVNQKATYVTLLGLDQARAAAKETLAQALSSLETLGDAAQPLREFASRLVFRAS